MNKQHVFSISSVSIPALKALNCTLSSYLGRDVWDNEVVGTFHLAEQKVNMDAAAMHARAKGLEKLSIPRIGNW